MNQYTLSALIAFLLFGMGLIAALLGGVNYIENRRSRKGIQMFAVCLCVFFWDFGYAWMSLSYESNVAYVARAIALLSVTFYMVFILQYVATVTEYPKVRLNVFLTIFILASLTAWFQIIQKVAIEFVRTPWGYWYTSKMSWARLLQFASIIAALIQYYVIMIYGHKAAQFKRDKYILNRFNWFGVILFVGYIFDTLIPTMAHTAAIPGSSISAFFSAMLLFAISRSNKTFGLSRDNVAEYVFDDVSVPVIITDNQKIIMLHNEVTHSYLECEDEELQGKNINEFFTEIDEIDASLVGEPENEESVRFVQTNHTVVSKICKMEKTKVTDRFGDLLYSIYFLQDVTKERDILHMLQESRLMAESASKAKSTFLANISHEIRTPINAVLGMNEMILRESQNPDIISYAKDIEGAGRNLLSLINDILDISKIESGKMELVPVEYDLGSVLSDSYNTVYLRAKEKNLDLLIQNNEFIPRGLYGDEVRIRQILTNLLTNAVKYTKAGSVCIKANYVQISADMINLIFSVSDTGIGLTKEQEKELFGDYKRFDEKENRNIEGTGLGLSITRTFIDMMDGKIEVESERGKGSTFTVTIPQKIVVDRPLGNMNERMSGGEATNKTKRQGLVAPEARVLVVDDVEMNLKVFRNLLKASKIQIDTCLSGEECLVAIQKKQYDIIFLDHMMPNMDGVETFQHIKEGHNHKNVDTPVVMLTANAIVGAEDEYRSLGLDDYLSKPIQWERLEEMIQKYLDKKESN